jgi:hypothetical protein
MDLMESMEKIYNDKTTWMFFEGEENETIGVYCRCPECGRYIKRGKLLMNMDGEIKLQGFICKVHGEIQPYYDRNC